MVKSFGRNLNEEEKKLIRYAAEIIDTKFDWLTTEEGYDFWNGVSVKLIGIAAQEPTCETCGQKLP